MNTRRTAIQNLGAFALGSMSLPFFHSSHTQNIQKSLDERAHLSAEEIAEDDTFWYQVQKAFNPSPHFINLENGYFSPQATEVMEAQIANIRRINHIPSYYMRTDQFEDHLNVKKQLADLAGCTHEEIVITRNTTESINTVIMGMDFEKGEEVILCDQDYGSMQEQFKQQAERRGIVLKYVELPLHPKSDEEIVGIYEKAITPKTRIMLVSQLINISGQVLPVRKICDMAHRHGVEVIVDGAHAFAQLDFKIPDLGADYFAASLHKWLCCRLGAGILYMKKEHIPKIWPLYGDVAAPKDSIRKFEHIGTRPVTTPLTISSAIKFHEMIGSKRKQERLRYLQRYWTDKVRDLPKVNINTPVDKERSCAIANIAVEGMKPHELSKYFFEEHRIFTVAINRKSVKGVRVTPHLYTSTKDLDKFVAAIEQIGS